MDYVAARRFAHHEIVRIPVAQTDEAKAVLASLSSESRLLAQALSEVFGRHSCVQSLALSVSEKRQHFVVGVEERMAHSGSEPMLLLVDVYAKADRYPRHRFYINTHDLTQVHIGTHMGFRAVLLAEELLSLYPYREDS